MSRAKSTIADYFKPVDGKDGKRKRDDEEPSNASMLHPALEKTSMATGRQPLRETTNLDNEARLAQQPPAKKVKKLALETNVKPPPNWEEVYALTQEMRAHTPAPVDEYGSSHLADKSASPQDQRFQTLVGLMLSAQTKDTITGTVMKNLHEKMPGGLTVASVQSIAPETLNTLISRTTYYDKKTKYIKDTASILSSRYRSDIPSTIAGLVSLPGVGPKMAHLTMSIAWGRHEGVSVDAHVHRITNLWGWHDPPTKSPEETRRRLESWLPRDKWFEINALLVGFGQTICLPVGRRCGSCKLAERGLCPGAVVGKKVNSVVKRGKVEEKSGKVQVEEEMTTNTENITADKLEW